MKPTKQCLLSLDPSISLNCCLATILTTSNNFLNLYRNFTSLYELFTSLYGEYRYLLLTNHITVFVITKDQALVLNLQTRYTVNLEIFVVNIFS